MQPHNRLDLSAGDAGVWRQQLWLRLTGRYFASDAYKADMARDPGKGRAACAYGEDHALWGWMIRASGVDLASLGGSVESAINLLSQPGLLAT